MELLLKGAISGALVVAASEVARRSTVAAAVLVSLPLTSMLALVWLHRSTRDIEQVVDLSWSILWVVAPSVVFFVALPLLLQRVGWSFWPAMGGAVVVMVAAYAVYVLVLSKFGIDAG